MAESADPGPQREAVIELLAVISYGEISAFERLAEDAALAPSLADKVALATMASSEFGKVAPLHDRIRALGGEPYAAIAPFREAVDEFHRHTAPADWYESLVKAYVGDRLAGDFYREIASVLDGETRDLVIGTVEKSAQAAFIVGRVRSAIEQDPTLGGRLALWARRLMGEALTQAQHVAAEHEALAELVAGPGFDVARLAEMFSLLTEQHRSRMAELGLEP
ncbi:ferritin-like domain-containing protein [Nocardioides panacisoli]|uniref:ferritin-like fold-containing protein n=1 Tax=Nocardioides panacisoli TaxID=627624 RepID=UPI001C635B5A|nr:ferritin-like fold-containing protein [Nocardioides panacisoli]QYJ02469.1 ferritin-like domain-containing protein [Nocardioides panacisoli]